VRGAGTGTGSDFSSSVGGIVLLAVRSDLVAVVVLDVFVRCYRVEGVDVGKGADKRVEVW